MLVPTNNGNGSLGDENRMSHYRGYFMKDGHIVAPAIVEAPDDAEALRKARELLSASQFLRLEVWHGSRLVGALSVAESSDENVAKDHVSNIAELRSG
jgi:hypothetical protein